MPPLPVICLAGPTGAGKTAMALVLAEELGCEIINADSRQTYADFPIVTAQPEKAEIAKAPHHLYAFLKTEEKLDAAAWAKLTFKKAEEIYSRNKIPLLVGGSGFYFQALLTSLADIPAIPQEISSHYARQIQSLGSTRLYEELKKIDPVFAAKIHPNDKQRIQRGLEVYSGTGQALSDWHKRRAPEALCSGPLFMIDSSISDLEPVLKNRIEKMENMGALEEVKRAWENCPDYSAPGWSGIGCRECLDYLIGRLDGVQWKKEWFANTRAYAKRQLTWFRGRKYAISIKPGDYRAILKHPFVIEKFIRA